MPEWVLSSTETTILSPDVIERKVTLYEADPDCKHEEDPCCYDGFRCCKCHGWFCF